MKGAAEVSLLFVDEASIAALNERFLGHTGPTDVLAFPVEDDPLPAGRFPDMGGTGPGADVADEPLMLLGDVVVCPAVAARNAMDHESTYEDEIALLVVHGLLHLLGMDHAGRRRGRAHGGARALAPGPVLQGRRVIVAATGFEPVDTVLLVVILALLARLGRAWRWPRPASCARAG